MFWIRQGAEGKIYAELDEMDKLTAQMLLNSGVMQYPDKNLYNAAVKLPTEERPTVPVRTYDDPKEAYEAIGSAPNYDSSAFVGPNKDAIYVNKTKDGYKDLNRLAAIMGHEQEHVRGGDETAAKLKEYQLLRALISRWKSNPRLKQLEDFRNMIGKTGGR